MQKKFIPISILRNKKAESHFKNITSAYDQIGNAEDRSKSDRSESEAEMAKQRGSFYNDTYSGGGRSANQFEGVHDDVRSSIFDQMGRFLGRFCYGDNGYYWISV